MKVLLVAHGYPPELVGGTEVSVQNLARGLVALGAEVVVVAGSLDHEAGFRTSAAQDGPIEVRRIHRADLYFDHWQKSASARVAEAFGAILEEVRPDVVHVHHWIRLSRDLVHVAAQKGVPAVVTLHDLWTTCLVAFRVRPDTGVFCEEPLGPHPCIACAAHVPPKTPWVSMENQFLAVAERRGDLVRELELARRVIVPSAAHARAVERYLALPQGNVDVRVVPHGRDLAFTPREPLPFAQGDRLVLGAWGHLHPLKGQDLLLDALERLDDPSRVALHLAGGTPHAAFAEEITRRAQALGVTLHGAFDADALDAHPVTNVHAMVSGTRAAETWGLVLDEAAALRLPMILPRSGAYADRMVEGRGAFFYEPRDADSLAGVLAALLDDPERLARARDAMPPLAEIAPSVAAHTRAVHEVYTEAIEAGAPDAAPPDWWRARMQIAAEEEWDESLKKRSADELGF